MDDLIRRQDALDLLNEQINQCDKALRYLSIVRSKIDEYAVKVERASLIAYKEKLESIPSAQQQHGDGGWKYYLGKCVCMACGAEFDESSPYCPKCGTFNGG